VMHCMSMPNDGTILSMNSTMQPNRSLGLKRVTDIQTAQYAYDMFSALILLSFHYVHFDCCTVRTTF